MGSIPKYGQTPSPYPSTYSTTPSAPTVSVPTASVPTGSGASGGDPMATMTADQQKYVQDQVLVAQGKMDPSQLTADWNAYLAAAQAWQTSSLGGNQPPSTILPTGEPTPSGTGSYPTISGLSEKYAVTPSSAGITPSGATTVSNPSVSSVSSPGGDTPVGGVPGYLAGSSTIGPGFANSIYAVYGPAIEAASRATGVSANILAAQVATESRGITNNVNPLQVSTGAGSDMAANILEGAKQLLENDQLARQKFGTSNLQLALRVYNSGPNGTNPNDVNSTLGYGQPYYVSQVLSDLQIIQSGQGSLPG